jgi:ABC-2 type transport system permease protein
MSRVLTIALRDVRSYFQDRADMVFGLLLPVAIFALMYGAFSGQSLFNGTAYIVNEDPDGIYSRVLIERLSAKENLEVALLSREEAEAKLSGSDILLVSIVPDAFSAQLSEGWPTQITFRQRGNGGMEGQIVAGLVRGEADALSQELQAERQVRLALADVDIGGDEVATTVHGLLQREKESPIITVKVTSVGGEANLVHQFMPGIVSMFVLFAVTLGSRAIVEERKKGTLERLLTTRVRVSELFAGKFVAGAARGFAQTFILLVLAYAVFRLFTPASFLLMLVVALVFAAAASALALVIASVARNDDQAVSISVVFTMASVMLGGTFFEIPEGSFLDIIGRASVNTYVNTAFKTVTTPGSGLADVAYELTVLAAVAVVALVLSRNLFRVVQGGR